MADVPVPLKDEKSDESSSSSEYFPIDYLDRLWLPITQSKTDFQQLYYSSS